MPQVERESAPGAPPASSLEPSLDQAMRRELERRLDALAVSETVAAPLSRRDWVATILLFVVLPLVLVWVFR